MWKCPKRGRESELDDTVSSGCMTDDFLVGYKEDKSSPSCANHRVSLQGFPSYELNRHTQRVCNSYAHDPAQHMLTPLPWFHTDESPLFPSD